ncbi:MAG: DNA (cytosine-5-)-methyltransferase, partial [bacterium]
MAKKIKIIDLFSGVGGLSYGFAQDDNFEIVATNEILPNMAKAYELNHPSVKVYCKDIKEFGIADLQKDFGINEGEIDLIVGGPPCQAYSTVGKRLIEDPRGKLFQEYYRVLKEIKPKVFLFENVKGLLSMQGGELVSTIISLFESLGYKVMYKVLNAADYGAPQIRERVIIIGTKLNSKFDYPEPTHYNSKDGQTLLTQDLKPHLTLSEAISDLPFIKSGEESFEYSEEPKNDFQKLMRKNAPEKLMDHNAPNNNQKLVKLMENLPDGGTPNDLPKELRPKSGFANTYCRLWWDRPSTTITRNLSTPSSSRCIHPKAPRSLTTREGARIQCFPDDYIFYGSRSDKNLQIGNAVPTFLSSALKESIKRHFSKQEKSNLYELGKRYIGIDVNEEYVKIAERRLAELDKKVDLFDSAEKAEKQVQTSF